MPGQVFPSPRATHPPAPRFQAMISPQPRRIASGHFSTVGESAYCTGRGNVAVCVEPRIGRAAMRLIRGGRSGSRDGELLEAFFELNLFINEFKARKRGIEFRGSPGKERNAE